MTLNQFEDKHGQIILEGFIEDISARKRNENLMRARLLLVEYANTHTVTELLQATLDQAGELVSSPIGFYHLISKDENSLWLQAWSTRTHTEFCQIVNKENHYPLDQAGVWADCARTRRPLIHNNYAALENRKGLPEGHAVLEREAVVPIIRNDKIMAVLGVGNKAEEYTQTDLETINALADFSWDIIERKIHEAEIQRYTNQLVTQFSLARTLAEADSLEIMFEAITRTATELLHVTFVRLALIENAMLVVRAVYPVRYTEYNLQLGQREELALLDEYLNEPDSGTIIVLNADDVRVQNCACRRLFVGAQKTLVVLPLRVIEQNIGYILLGEERTPQREPFDQDKQQLGYNLANQAASAIHRAQLSAQTRADAVELENAYEATIEGWSHALDLRDKETEGHTLRVTEMTLRLARVFGFSDEQMTHIRRGALLHDIGKMGIPDSILLKPGTLTPDEWDIMHQHPDYAQMLLAPIHYLEPALAIPYCHHEKWDGTGYPRGLKGEEIPLEARLFAIVDVWDALSSNRPYRAALSKTRVLEYLRHQSGKHFDPQVVRVFLEMLKQEN